MEPAPWSTAREGNELIDAELDRGRRWVARALTAAFPPPMLRARTVQPPEAAGLLRRYWSAIATQLQRVVRQRPSAEWLWLLRALDSLLIDPAHPTEQDEVLRLAEYLSAFSTTVPQPAAQFSWTPDRAFDVVRLVDGARELNRISQAIRRAGKGLAIAGPNRPGQWIAFEHDSAIDEAIRQFDRRQSESVGRLAFGLLERRSITASTSFSFLIALRTLEGWHPTTQWDGPLSEQAFVTDEGQFAVFGLDLEGEGAADTLRRIVDRSTDRVSVRRALVISAASARLVKDDDLSAGRTLARNGYITVDLARLVHATNEASTLLRRAVGPIAEGTLELAPSAPTSSPIHHGDGPALRSSGGDSVVVDVYAITSILHYGLHLDVKGGGPIANDAAFEFELLTQSLIDAAGNGLRNVDRALRGTVLRSGGRAITDIDALFRRGSELFLVSCKHWTRPREYDGGDFRIVRNVSSRLAEAAAEWQRRVTRIRALRKGDNFDFSQYVDIRGIVVTPHALYTTDQLARSAVSVDGAEIPFCASLDELLDALGNEYRVPAY